MREMKEVKKTKEGENGVLKRVLKEGKMKRNGEDGV